MSSPFLLSARAFAGRLLIALVLVSTLMVAGDAAINRGINDRLESVRKINPVVCGRKINILLTRAPP